MKWQPTELTERALPANAPYGYVPQTNDCPSDSPSIRQGGGRSDQEADWLEMRRNNTIEPMIDLLGRMNIDGLDTEEYINNHRDNASALPNIAIAVSGGGYRAMMNGAGVVEAFDSRTDNSTSSGQLGGLLQSSTYLAGLSGGGWLVGSLYTNNFTSIQSILAENFNAEDSDQDSGSLWKFGNSIFEGPDQGGIQLFDSIGYYRSIVSSVGDKSDADFNTTITDYWGRALSYQLVNATNGGPEFTFSSIAEQDWFSDAEAPLPFLVADGRAPGETLIPSNTTVYTFSPWELGSDDPTVFGWAPLQYVGTNYTEGEPRDDNECVTGFDNVGFVMGTSSSLFNQFLLRINESDAAGVAAEVLQSAIERVLVGVARDDNDIADYPNPFYHYNNDTNLNAESIQLTLVDGGEDGQNIPLNPLIQPHREVDVIFAVDSSADTDNNWPDGSALISTYRRSETDIQNGTSFPIVPGQNTFINLGLNNQPTFFGCDASNATNNGGDRPAPLIVYLPNGPYSFESNFSTFNPSYNDSTRNAAINNGYNLATQGNGTLDEDWPACVGCAILSRSLERTGTDVPEVCEQCFERYCWDGTTNESDPDAYEPELKLNEVDVSEDDDSGAARAGVAGGLAVAVAAVLGAVLL